jgi:hypothetical protein
LDGESGGHQLANWTRARLWMKKSGIRGVSPSALLLGQDAAAAAAIGHSADDQRVPEIRTSDLENRPSSAGLESDIELVVSDVIPASNNQLQDPHIKAER